MPLSLDCELAMRASLILGFADSCHSLASHVPCYGVDVSMGGDGCSWYALLSEENRLSGDLAVVEG